MSETKFTKGPWGWFGNASGCPDIYLATTHSGRKHVMGFRRWGMKGSQPCFRQENGSIRAANHLLQFEVGDQSVIGVDAAKNDESVYRYQIRGIASPDAYLIAAAPDLYEALSDLLSSIECDSLGIFILEKEIKIARAALTKARGETA